MECYEEVPVRVPVRVLVPGINQSLIIFWWYATARVRTVHFYTMWAVIYWRKFTCGLVNFVAGVRDDACEWTKCILSFWWEEIWYSTTTHSIDTLRLFVRVCFEINENETQQTIHLNVTSERIDRNDSLSSIIDCKWGGEFVERSMANVDHSSLPQGNETLPDCAWPMIDAFTQSKQQQFSNIWCAIGNLKNLPSFACIHAKRWLPDEGTKTRSIYYFKTRVFLPWGARIDCLDLWRNGRRGRRQLRSCFYAQII